MLVLALAAFGAALSAAQVFAATQTYIDWQDMSGSIPAATSFKDIAATPSGIVVAVGDQSNKAALYHRAPSGAWVSDTVTLPDGAKDSSLTAVAIGPSHVLAIGTYKDKDNVIQPLIERASLANVTAGTSQPLEFVAAPAAAATTGAMATPLSVAMSSGSGAGAIGDDKGQVFPFDDASASFGPAAPVPTPGSTPGPVTGLAFYGDDGHLAAGLAVTGKPPTANTLSPIFRFRIADNAATITPASISGPMPTNLKAVSANANSNAPSGNESAGSAIALDAGDPGSPGYLEPSGDSAGSWSSKTSPFIWGSAVKDGAIGQGSAKVEAVAGAQDSRGSVWRCALPSPCTWTRDDLGNQVRDALGNKVNSDGAAYPTMNAVAVVNSVNIWAAGDGGKIVQYHQFTVTTPGRAIKLPDTRILSGPAENATIPTVTRDFTFAAVREKTGDDIGDRIGFLCSWDAQPQVHCDGGKITVGPLEEGQHTFRVAAVNETGIDTTPAIRTFYVRIPPLACRLAPKELVKKVTVQRQLGRRKQPGKLIVSFSLAARARVQVTALSGSRTAGRTSWFTLEKGRRRLVVPLRQNPTSLRLTARPASKCST